MMKAGQIFTTEKIEYGSFAWLRREVGIKLGYHADARLLGNVERSYIDSIIESGINQFAHMNFPSVQIPQSIEDIPSGEEREGMQVENNKSATRRAPHRWSFLNLTATIAMVAGENTYDLPDDFGSFICEPTSSRPGERIAIVPESHLRQLVASDPKEGPPKYCTTQRTSIGGGTVAKSKLLVYPTPMASETIQVEYAIAYQTLDDLNTFPIGGREHAETVLAACWYVAAMRTGKDVEIAASHLRDRLVASIVVDRAASKPTADGVWTDDDGKYGYSYLLKAIGRYCGHGPNPSAWSHAQSQLNAEILRRALRKVYNPPLVGNSQYPHFWSFLRPLHTMTLASGQSTYDLPAEYSGLDGPLTHASDGARLFPKLTYVNESMIRSLLQQTASSGRPDKAAIRPKAFNRAEGQRYEILFWPTPDSDYSIQFRMRVNPDSVGLLPVAEQEQQIYGLDVHSEMFLEAAYLAADEIQGVKRSEHAERFLRCVAAAVGRDQVMASPESLGYNADRSNGRDRDYDEHGWSNSLTTYGGYTP